MDSTGHSIIKLRAHHLLCLQGFKGLGYSAQFVAGMSRISRKLRLTHGIKVQVVIGADDICENCPHRFHDRCTKLDPEGCAVATDAPDSAKMMDSRVLKWLDIREGEVLDWLHLLNRLGNDADGTIIDIVCGDCEWKEKPFCREELNRLRQRVLAGELKSSIS